jgi:hypothetical protein
MRSLISVSGSQRLALAWVDSQVLIILNPRPGLLNSLNFTLSNPTADGGTCLSLPLRPCSTAAVLDKKRHRENKLLFWPAIR